MIIIGTSKSNKIFLTIAGIISIVLGFFLFPRSIFQGFFEILPISISSLFICVGFAFIYSALLYRIIIDKEGVTTGSSFYNKKIPNHKIKGFFTFEIPSKKEKILQLAILLQDGKSKVFNGSNFNERIEQIDEALAKKYPRLEGKEKSNFITKRKNKQLRILSYVGLAIALLGVVQIFGFFKPAPKLISVQGTLMAQPKFTYNKRGSRATRINLKLTEYPDLTFSEVGDVGYLEEWAKLTAKGEKISIQISEKDFKSKIKKTLAPDQIILNYTTDMIEIKSLTHQRISTQPIYQEDIADGLIVGIFLLLSGIGMFFYYQRDIAKLKD